MEHYDGKLESIWQQDGPDGTEVLKHLVALSGLGDQKARIFLTLLGKQMGVKPAGWREAVGAYGEEGVSTQHRRRGGYEVARRGPRVQEGGQGSREGLTPRLPGEFVDGCGQVRSALA